MTGAKTKTIKVEAWLTLEEFDGLCAIAKDFGVNNEYALRLAINMARNCPQLPEQPA